MVVIWKEQAQVWLTHTVSGQLFTGSVATHVCVLIEVDGDSITESNILTPNREDSIIFGSVSCTTATFYLKFGN